MALIRGSQITGSVASASFAATASYALNAGDIFPFSGSAVITGSLVVTEGITGSMQITNLSSGSYTQSFTNQSTWLVQHNLNSAYVVVQTYDSNEEQMLPQTIDLTDANTTTITFPTNLSGTAVVMVGTPLAGGGGGGNTSVSASHAVTASYALNGGSLTINTGSFATTGSNTFRADQIISGSVYVSGGLSVGDSNIRIDTDEAFPFVVGYGSNTPNIKTNTVLGYFVLNNNTTGNYNVGVGFTAMQNNTTGHSNVAIGPGALGSNDTGFRNVGIGFEAAGAAVVNNSVALGYWALRGGGGNSVAVGYEAGRYSTPTSYRNVYLGYGAGPTASVTESDKLYIANAAGSPLIGGDFSTRIVTISGSVEATSFTGSLLGSASFAVSSSTALSASYAASASLAVSAQRVITVQTTTGTGPYYPVFATDSGVSSFLRTDPTTFTYNATTNTLTVTSSAAISASFATTASYALNALSIVDTGSFYTTSSFGFYGSFCSTGSQTNPVADVSRSMQLETTEIANGVSIVSGSRITVANAGVYNLQFSAQLEKTTNGVDHVYIWFKKNGTNVPRSNTNIDVARQAGGAGRVVAAWNYVDTLVANDYLEIVWQSSDTSMQLLAATATGNLPAIPSVIATLTQVR